MWMQGLFSLNVCWETPLWLLPLPQWLAFTGPLLLAGLATPVCPYCSKTHSGALEPWPGKGLTSGSVSSATFPLTIGPPMGPMWVGKGGQDMGGWESSHQKTQQIGMPHSSGSVFVFDTTKMIWKIVSISEGYYSNYLICVKILYNHRKAR
jgi:hypothetical protein